MPSTIPSGGRPVETCRASAGEGAFRRIDRLTPQALQPRAAVIVVGRDSPAHLFDVRGRVEIVRIDENTPKPRGEEVSDGGFPERETPMIRTTFGCAGLMKRARLDQALSRMLFQCSMLSF